MKHKTKIENKNKDSIKKVPISKLKKRQEPKQYVEIINKRQEEEISTWESIKKNTHNYFYLRRFIPEYFAWKAGMAVVLISIFIILRVVTSYVILRNNDPNMLNNGIRFDSDNASSVAIAVAYNNGLFFGIAAAPNTEWIVWLSGAVIILGAFIAIIFVESRSLFFFLGLFIVGAFSNYLDRIIFRVEISPDSSTSAVSQPVVIDYFAFNFNQIFQTTSFSGTSIWNSADFLIIISLFSSWLIFVIKLFTGDKKKEISKKNEEINARIKTTNTNK